MPEPFEKSGKFPAPDDLTTLTLDVLRELETTGVAEFDSIHSRQEYAPEDVAYAMQLRTDLDRVKAELSARKVREETLAAQAKLQAERTMAELRDGIHGPATGTPEEKALRTVQDQDFAEKVAAATASGTLKTLLEFIGSRPAGTNGDLVRQVKMASLGDTAAHLPESARKAPEARLAITASGTGQDVPGLEALAALFTEKAQSLPATTVGRDAARYPVAKIRNEFTHTVDERTNPAEIEELWRSMVDEGAPALVAGGGWCAPSEQMYNFFNIADMDGQVDLPTVGVTRGGIKFPVSPAIGDVFFQSAGSNPASGFGGFAFAFSNASDPWLWTESDDIATVTGSVNKPTLRVPCPSFNEVRLEAYGLTVTAGNLADSAYPEATQNFIRLLRMAYAHAINARKLSLMDTLSGSATTIGAITTDPAAPRIFNSVALAATDYRARYAMRTDAVLEVIMPYWVKEVIRADLAYKQGINSTELLAVVDAQINAFFTARSVRVQWVNDYQVRGASQFGNATNLTTWPTTVNFLVYAAGTFLHGTGLSLDLGVVRDSVLNAENDHTAAWAEEAHLVAMVGHASRKYTCAFQVNGASGGGTTARV